MQKEPTHALEGHANSTQKGLSQDSNQDPPYCEAMVPPTIPQPTLLLFIYLHIGPFK